MSLSITQSSTRHLLHVDRADSVDGPRPAPDSLVYATGQPFSGPAHRDPHTAAAFDRWTSQVEVCASIRPTSLTVLGQAPIHFNPPLRLLPAISSMVRAPFSDTEDEPRATLANRDEHGMTPGNRKRHACELCDKAFDRPSTLKTVSLDAAHAYQCSVQSYLIFAHWQHLLVHTGITRMPRLSSCFFLHTETIISFFLSYLWAPLRCTVELQPAYQTLRNARGSLPRKAFRISSPTIRIA
jgi:hypothetical protein